MSLPDLIEPFYDENHRCKSWITRDANGPSPLVLWSGRDYWQLNAHCIPILWDTGLLPFARLSVGRHSTLDGSLLSILVDRWRPETGEVTLEGLAVEVNYWVNSQLLEVRPVEPNMR